MGDQQQQLIPVPPKPSGTVTLGRPIKVLANTYSFRSIPTGIIYHYDVVINRAGIDPEERTVARQSRAGQGTVVGYPERVSRGIIRFMENSAAYTPRAGYDGNKSIYSPKPLIQKGQTAPYPDEETYEWKELAVPESGNAVDDKCPKYDVYFRLANKIDMSKLQNFFNGQLAAEDNDVQICITALNTIFNHEPWMKYPSKKTSFFDPAVQRDEVSKSANAGGGRGGRGAPRGGRGGPGRGGNFSGGPPSASETGAFPVRNGVEIWRGYYTSIRPVPRGLVYNVDVTHMPFLSANVLNRVMSSLIGGSDNDLSNAVRNHKQFRTLLQLLKNVRISYNIRDGKMHRVIKEISKESAEQKSFDIEGRPTSIAQYWRDTYNVSLRHPEWPCVRVSKNAWIPIELCYVEVGNKYNASLTPDQISSAIRFTTMKPLERASFIRRIDFIRPEVNPILADAGISLDQDIMQVEGVVLDKPEIAFIDGRNSGKRTIQVSDRGDWRPGKFIKGAELKNWIVAVFASEREMSRGAVQEGVGALNQALFENGVQVHDSAPPIYYSGSSYGNDVVGCFRRWGGEYRNTHGVLPAFMLCYIGNSGTTTPEHVAIKKFGDRDVGVATQCVSVSKLASGQKASNRQYWANVALKINPKLSNPSNPLQTGVNHEINGPAWSTVKEAPTMIVGADCTHPAPGSREPSFAAVVGSIDPSMVQYTSAYAVQESRQETIDDMKPLMKTMLREFSKKNNCVPQRLIMYRDGVSEGQFQIVLRQEVPRVQDALREHMEEAKARNVNVGSGECKITYVICAKRHHIRFIPTNDRDADRNYNVPAGTYVDRSITIPNAWQFYLLSHQGLLGTSRPTLYTVIKDENNFTADKMAALTNNLCYIYARSTRAVSIATPAYYAHHVCTRAKELGQPRDDDTASSFSRESNESAEKQALLEAYQLNIKSVHAKLVNTLYYM